MSSSEREPLGPARVEDLGGGLYAYVQPDGGWFINNTGFMVGRAGAVCVDASSTEKRTRALLAAVGEVSRAPVRTLVNTHSHPDHTQGNSLFGTATIVAHERTRAEVRAGIPAGALAAIWEPMDTGDCHSEPPFLTYTEGVTVWVDDLRCEVRHVGRPAHTTNDSIVWIPERSVLYAGDLAFKGGTPFLLSGSVAGAVEVLTTVLAPLEPAVVVPGHGPVCGPEVFDETLDYLRFVQRVAADAHAAKVTPLAAALDTDLGRFAGWTDPERIVGNLHRAMAELDGAEPGAQIDLVGALRDMVRYNGGAPLTCRA